MSFRPYDHPDFEQARALQKRVGVVDLHVDSIIQQILFRYNVRKRHRAGFKGQPLIWHADIPRLREAGYKVICMGIHYWPWESKKAWRLLNKQIDYLDKVAAEDPDAMRIHGPDDWDAAFERGVLGMVPGVEGAHLLAGNLGRVQEMASRGVAYLTLAHFSRNSAATPSMGRGANERDGLTDFGRALVAELNRWGVTIDCAHVNTPGVMEVCELTKAPIFCTHTGVKGVHDVSRNVSDAEIDAIAHTDGVIGIMYASTFLAGSLRTSSQAIVDHIDYVVKRVGVRHVCLGSDYDGWIPIPRDQRDCRDVVKVTDGLLRRGYSEQDIALILRDNAARVRRASWEARLETASPYRSAS